MSETTTEQLAEIEGQGDTVQVREGRWRTRHGAVKNIRPCEPLRGAYFVWPWTDGVMTFQDNGWHQGSKESPNDLVEYLGPIEPDKTQELPDKTQELPDKTQELPEYTPPEGWRVLAVGERLRDGDVTVRRDGYQYPTERVGGWVGSNQRYIRPIEPQPQPEAATIEELRSEVSYVQRLLGESRQRVTHLEELVTSLRTINEAQEKSFNAANKANDDLQHRLNVVAAEWAEQAETIRRLQIALNDKTTQCEILQIELDAAQQVPQAIADRFEEGWNQGTARAVETVLAWLEPIRLVDHPNLANETLQHLPQIMRHLTGLAQD